MKNQPKYLFLVAVAACAIGASEAYADKGGHGHGKKHEKYEDHEGRVVITSGDRVIIKRYIAEDYHSHCPPGLAKKHNGCVPPGHAKRYIIGQPLTVDWVAVPQPLLVQLQPVPVGYRYVMVDNDVLLMNEASHHIIDAITLLSAVGN